MAARRAYKINCILRGFNLVGGMLKVRGDSADVGERNKRGERARFDARGY